MPLHRLRPRRATRALVALATLVTGPACEPPPATAPPPVVADVRAGRHPGFDRVVVELEGARVPDAVVEVATAPVREEGSGREVAVAGRSILLLHLSPAFSRDPSVPGPPRSWPTRLAVGGAAVVEVVLVSDFEGVLTWAIGLRHPAAHHLRTATGPTRVVVDVDR